MKCKNIVYKVTEAPTMEKVREYKEAGYFFRFNDAYIRCTPNSKSWGMIYKSAAEARRDGAGDSIKNGKSCVENLIDLTYYIDEFTENDVVLVFEGHDTRESTDDMYETVATFYEAKAVWSYSEFLSFIPTLEKAIQEDIRERYNNTDPKLHWTIDDKGIKI